MRPIDLKMKPAKVFTLRWGGWIVSSAPMTWRHKSTNNSFVRSDGSVKNLGQGLLKYSPKLDQFAVEGVTKVIWSESGDLEDLTNKHFTLAKDSAHCSCGLFVSTGVECLAAAKKAEEYKNRHRRFANYDYQDPQRVIGTLFAAVPEFTVDALAAGGKSKKSIFFLKVSTGEHVSIEAVGLEGKLLTALPSYDGLTALCVDSAGKALLLDNPF